MTRYEIDISETAETEIDALFQWLNFLSPIAANRFRDNLAKAIDSLILMPTRCVVARENALYEREVRLHTFASGRSTYRVLFTIFEEGEEFAGAPALVYLLHVRHGSARPLTEEANP